MSNTIFTHGKPKVSKQAGFKSHMISSNDRESGHSTAVALQSTTVGRGLFGFVIDESPVQAAGGS